MTGYEHELKVAMQAAHEASAAILAVYDSAAVYQKADGSEVTDADLASDQVIRAHLSRSFPDDAVLTEEGVDDPARLLHRRCWIVDPIDGTAAFVRRTGDFDVYIALAIDGTVVVAVTIQPTTGLLLFATAGGGAWATEGDNPPERVRFARRTGGTRIGTRPWLGAPGNLPILHAVADRLGGGSVAFAADDGLGVRSLYPPDRDVDVIAGISANGSVIDGWEWDIAAVDLFVREAGGASSDLNGGPLRFNRPQPRFSDGFLWSADPETHGSVLTALHDGLPGR